MRITEMNTLHIELTDAIKAHAEKKVMALADLTEKFEPCDIKIQLGKTSKHHQKGNIFLCQLDLMIPGATFRSECKKDDLYATIDIATKDLRRQIVDHKNKMQDKRKAATS